MIQKLNTILTGILMGIILPAIFYFWMVYPKMKHFTFIGEQYGLMVVKFLPIFLSRCILPNAILFFVLLWFNQHNSAKGLLIVTAVITAILLILNFIL